MTRRTILDWGTIAVAMILGAAGCTSTRHDDGRVSIRTIDTPASHRLQVTLTDDAFETIRFYESPAGDRGWRELEAASIGPRRWQIDRAGQGPLKMELFRTADSAPEVLLWTPLDEMPDESIALDDLAVPRDRW